MNPCHLVEICMNILQEGVLNRSRKQMMESKMLETESTIEPETMNMVLIFFFYLIWRDGG
jgi:hypothetical protein